MQVLRPRAAAKRLLGGLPTTYWYLWMGYLAARIGTFVLPFLTLYLTSERGLSASQATLVASLYGMGTFAATLASGVMVDRLGRRATALVSLAVGALVVMPLGLAHSFWLIAIVAVLAGFFSDAMYWTAVAAAVSDVVRSTEQMRAFGFLFWAQAAGGALAGALGGLMATRSFLLLFVADALASAVFALVVWLRVPETRPASEETSGEDAGRATGTRGLVSGLLREPLLLSVTGLTFLLACVLFQSQVTLPLAMRQDGLSSIYYGALLTMEGALIVALTTPTSHLLGGLPRCRVLAASAVLVGVGFGIYALAESFAVYVAGVVVWTLGQILVVPTALALVADLAPPELRGIFQGVYGSAWGLSFFVAPVIGGLVLEYGGTGGLWVGCLVLGGVVAVGYTLLDRQMRRLSAATTGEEV